MADVRRLAVGATSAVMTAGAAALTGRALVRRMRHAPDEEPGEDFVDLADLGATHRHLVARDGGSLHMLTKGSGRPVVLLHGVAMQAGAWRYVFALADRYRVIAPDARGHGRSVAGKAGYGLDALADDIADVLVRLDLRDALLVGHSMGGMAMMRFLTRHARVLRDRVSGIVLVSTSADPVLGFGTGGSLRLFASVVQAPAERLGWRRLPTYRPTDGDLHFGLLRLSFGDDAPPHHVEATRRMVQAMSPEALNRSFLGLLSNDSVSSLRKVDVPAVVVVGSRDLLTPMRSAKRIAKALKGSVLHVLPGAGHMLTLERPDELVDIVDALAQRTELEGAASPTARP